MPAPAKVLVPCPHCGARQAESPAAISTVCRKCGGYFQLHEAFSPPVKTSARTPPSRRVACFDCGTELEVAVSAESTMCKRCSRYVDLHDYRIARAISKNFKTKGRFVIDAKGYVFNSEATVGDAVIKGRFLGKLVAERSLTIHSTADIKGTFTAGCLIIPLTTHFHWKGKVNVGSAEIAGELNADLQAEGTIILKSSARLFGDVEAGNLVVEEGAVVVGNARIGLKAFQLNGV